MNNLTKSLKTLGEVANLLVGNNFSRPIEKVMAERPYFPYQY
jgi:hypothetical protein